MFYIERYLYNRENLYSSLLFRVDIKEDGYRIVIRRNATSNNNRSFREERNNFVDNIRHMDKDLYLIHVCNGNQYILKILVIYGAIYIGGKLILFLPTQDYLMSCTEEQARKINREFRINIEFL